MHYYQFNIGDYQSHTNHLTPEEDIAYRRMMDWCYLHEKPLPLDIDEISAIIRMRTHSECIANVLRWFFKEGAKGYHQKRIDDEIKKYKNKSKKARDSANKRWNKENKGLDGDAKAMRTHSERNAKHKPLTNNHKPVKDIWLTPEWINQKAWSEFEEHRKNIKKPLSDLARAKAAKTLQGFTHEEQQSAIDLSIQSRWAGLFPKKLNGAANETNQRTNQSTSAQFWDRTKRRIQETAGESD